jgi:hypothetical protein
MPKKRNIRMKGTKVRVRRGDKFWDGQIIDWLPSGEDKKGIEGYLIKPDNEALDSMSITLDEFDLLVIEGILEVLGQ